MNTQATVLLLLSAGLQFSIGGQLKNKRMKSEQTTFHMTIPSDEESAIRALEKNFIAAFNAGDVAAMMNCYVSDSSLIVFDVVPRKQYRGADAYRDDWIEFFAHFNGRPKIAITDLGITADGNVGFGHSFQHITGTDKQGRPVDRWVRVTDGYRKVHGKWLIAMEHVSVPVNMATGKASSGAKP